MTIDGVNEVKLHALEMAMDVIRDTASGIEHLKPQDKIKLDMFDLADKIYNYISSVA